MSTGLPLSPAERDHLLGRQTVALERIADSLAELTVIVRAKPGITHDVLNAVTDQPAVKRRADAYHATDSESTTEG